MNTKNLNGLIISAGLSKRMGRLKPLITFDGKPFLVHIILKLIPVCHKLLIVVGYKAELIKDEIINWLRHNNPELVSKIHWYNNPDFENGMLTSLQKGLYYLHDSEWILYHFADQPSIPADFYPNFVNQIDEDHDWIQPAFQNQSGHPLLISKKNFNSIIKLKSHENLRDLIMSGQVNRKLWSCPFSEILQDFDTPQQLAELTGNR